MEQRKNLAIENFKKGYNCSQAVVCAYCDALGIREEDAFRMAEGFGGGMGRLGETCGAVTGMYMILSLINSKGDLDNPRETKMQTYQSIQALAKEFEAKNKSTICRELKGETGGPVLRSCIGCVEDAAALLDAYLSDMPSKENK
ncbi:MAG: C_GCAxxG_C_C family protein [Cellulosilyticum sp.]|nr:C_GCAxxG_C_C family protein [Cellulosilyticum sp.]